MTNKQSLPQLAEGWEWSTLGDVFWEVKNGTTVTQNKECRGIPVTRIETIQNSRFALQRIGYVDGASSDLIRAFQYHIGDIAFSHINSLEHVGKTALYEGVPESLLHGMNLLRLRLDHDNLHPRFLHTAMQQRFFRDEVRNRVGRAVNQVSINQRNLSDVPLPIAPLAEQPRIVEKVDELFLHVNSAREHLSSIPAILKRFRHAVLAAACSGRLTEEWREEHTDIESAVDLLRVVESDAKKKVVSKQNTAANQLEEQPFELPSTWAWASVRDVCVSVTDGDHQPPPKAHSGVPFLVISDINKGKMDMKNTMFVPRDYYERISLDRKPRRGDILYSVTGSFGIPAIVDTDAPFCFQRHIALLRPHYRISSSYLFQLMASDLLYRQAASVATGIAQLTVPLSGLRALRLPVAPAEEQAEIARRVDKLFLLADSIERQVSAAAVRCNKLTQSILTKAFRGELVPTEAELARREGRDYEPASVLLERIKKERQQHPSSKSKTKRINNTRLVTARG